MPELLKGRPERYDRHPSVVARGWNASAEAPHASTQRWSYILEAGKKAKIGGISLHYCVVTALDAGARVQLTVRYNKPGSSTDVYTISSEDAPAAGVKQSLGVNADIDLVTVGDELELLTLVEGAGGSVNLHGGMLAMEYDQ